MSDEPFEGVTTAHADAEGVTIVRVFNASRQELFDAWTKPEHFSRWFGENDSEISAENIEMDPRPGGKWHATMIHGPDRIEIPFQGEFVEVVEPERAPSSWRRGTRPEAPRTPALRSRTTPTSTSRPTPT